MRRYRVKEPVKVAYITYAISNAENTLRRGIYLHPDFGERAGVLRAHVERQQDQEDCEKRKSENTHSKFLSIIVRQSAEFRGGQAPTKLTER